MFRSPCDNLLSILIWFQRACADSEGEQGVQNPENHKNIGFYSNTGPDPLVKLCIMLSHASKGHNLILMISYICRVILNYTMTSLTLCCLVMTLSISLCYSSVVNKHQLLALSVLCIYYGINNGSRANIRISQLGFEGVTCNGW